MTFMPVAQPVLTLDGAAMSFETLAHIAEGSCKIVASPEAMARVAAGRAAFLAAMSDGRAVYGTTTGVGGMKSTGHQGDAVSAFSQSLPYAHQIATGEELPQEYSRVTAALRLNTALSGRVGVSSEFVGTLLAMLNNDLLPVLHRRGSVGCADLGQMGELGAAMAGRGQVRLRGEKMAAETAFARCNLVPHRMQVRDGLASVASNAFGVGASALTLRRAGLVVRRAMVQAAAASQAMGLDRSVWKAAAHGLEEEQQIAAWLCKATSGVQHWPIGAKVHDPLSGRMLVQIMATATCAVSEAASLLGEQSGIVDDNPVLVDDQIMTSGGSLLPILALRLGGVQLSLAMLARNILNRSILLTNGQVAALPVNLVPPGTVATGYGPLMKLALEQYSRVAAAAAPVVVFNQALAVGLEDEAVMIALVAEKICEQLDAMDWLLTVEALVSAQALDLWGMELDGIAAALHSQVRAHIAPLTEDVPLSEPLSALNKTLTSSALMNAMVADWPLQDFDELMGLGLQEPN